MINVCIDILRRQCWIMLVGSNDSIILYYNIVYHIIIYILYGLMCPTSRLFAAAVLAASEVVLRPQDIAISLCQAART